MALRLAQVSATYPPYHGGTGNVCYHNAHELARLGHNVHVFTAAQPGAPAFEAAAGVYVHRYRPVVAVGNAPILPQLLAMLGRFDLIHLHSPFIGGSEITSLAAASFNVPLVVTYHSDLVMAGTWRDFPFRLATWSSRNLVLSRAARILFVSEGHALTCDMSGVYRARRRDCGVFANAVDVRHFQPAPDKAAIRCQLGLPAGVFLVGFVGGLDSAHHYKGLEVLLDALARSALAGAHLLVVGDGNLKQHYERQCARLSIGNRVHFHGGASQVDLPALYQACDVTAVPSLVPESFGLVITESLACGVPVVASDGAGVRSMGELGIKFVEPGNAAALAAALKALSGDGNCRQTLGNAGRAQVLEHFNWEHKGRELDAVYREVLSRRA